MGDYHIEKLSTEKTKGTIYREKRNDFFDGSDLILAFIVFFTAGLSPHVAVCCHKNDTKKKN